MGVVCAITGPSGSGKSTLAEEIVYRGVARALGDSTVDRAGPHDSIEGLEGLSRAVLKGFLRAAAGVHFYRDDCRI